MCDAGVDDCSCSAIHSACATCVKQTGGALAGDAALLMLDGLPDNYDVITTIVVTSATAEGGVAQCAAACSEADAATCLGFTFVATGSSAWSCVLVSSHGDDKTPSPGARFFVLQRCIACGADHVIDSRSCVSTAALTPGECVNVCVCECVCV